MLLQFTVTSKFRAGEESIPTLIKSLTGKSPRLTVRFFGRTEQVTSFRITLPA
ncbi:Uncharacterised protein [Enterobacter cloacae]|nr:Uncharacterised protein [Enterobacter cloacae]